MTQSGIYISTICNMFSEGLSDDDESVAWIGLNDRDQEGTFSWSSGHPVAYLNWGHAEPDNLHFVFPVVYISLLVGTVEEWI